MLIVTIREAGIEHRMVIGFHDGAPLGAEQKGDETGGLVRMRRVWTGW